MVLQPRSQFRLQDPGCNGRPNQTKPSASVVKVQEDEGLNAGEAIEYVQKVEAASDKAIEEIETKKTSRKPRGRGKR